MQEAARLLRWLLLVPVLLIGLVIFDTVGLPRAATPEAAAGASPEARRGGADMAAAAVAVEIGAHRLLVPPALRRAVEVPVEGRRGPAARAGLTAQLPWADLENPVSAAARRCLDARPRCREVVRVTASAAAASGGRGPVAGQWQTTQRNLVAVPGGEDYGLGFLAQRGSEVRPAGTVEFAERRPLGGLVRGRCPRLRREGGSMAIDPAGTCTLAFDLRPGLTVTLSLRGDRLAEWRRAQAAAATLLDGLIGLAAEQRRRDEA